ncbi:TPA: GNAT family N-acetyltransferase [Campylobacter jejuni]|nr:GNAT family N-acetyltransferase [Campylobacter jejuni]EEK8793966.1 GNAT family N-acetyltransferase [Campylobacter jejuni]HEB8235543.1 GNAT family N-acetyltransferase [Campylobacter jejuni]HED6016071.1 GNAT family N-acetyltransferase [Campylobacter jejuni]
MIIKKYDKNDFITWNEFNKKSKNGLFMFDRNYMDYHSDRFIDHSLMFYEDEKLLALLPLNEKNGILYSHQGLTFGGFICDGKMQQYKMIECFKILLDYMKDNAFTKLIYKSVPYIYHKKASQEDLYALFVNEAKLYRVDSSSVIYLDDYKFTKGRKYQISKAIKENIKIEESNDYKGFVKLLNEVLLKQHNAKAVHNANELILLHSKFPENIKLFVAKKEEDIVAATLLFIYENLVHTQYLANSDYGREYGALDLLLKTLIEKYSKDKKYFDFGISNENNGLYLNQGLIFQKESFGARTMVHNFWEINL